MAIASGADDGRFLEEIVVTATKRTVDVQQLPIAVSVVTAQSIHAMRMTTIDTLAQQVPDLVVSAAGNTTPWVFLRGVGTNDINANSVGAVGIYQDEVYMNGTATQLQQMVDLDRVEVLKGPQGTLYGRNTTGGVINLVSMKPQAVDSASGRVSYGRYDQLDIEAIGNVAINDELAARLALVRHSRDPVFENTHGAGDGSDIDNWAARGALRYQRGDQDWLLSVYGSSVDAKATEFDKSLIAQHPQRADVGVPRSEPLSWPGHEKVDILGGTLHGAIDFGSVALASISAVVNSRRDTRVDIDSSAPDWLDQTRRNEATQLSQELRLASRTEGPLEWVSGLYFFREDLDATVLLEANQALNVPALTFVSDTEYSQRDTSAAAFGDATWRTTDRLSLFAGGRYTYEEKDFRTSQQGYFNAPLTSSRQRQSWTRPSGSAGFSYAFTAQVLGYGRYSHGFRAGGFNAGGGVDDPAFGPEYVDMFEVGMKSTFADGRARLNAALFSAGYRDMQVYALVSSPAGPTTQYLTNAARASIEGIEADLSWRPLSHLQIDLSAAWIDAQFDRYVDGSNIDRAGNRLAGAPETSWSAIVRYDQPLVRGAKFVLSADANYRDGFYFDAANTGRFAADARHLVGARLAYVSADERFSVALWGRNLGDELHFVRATSFLNMDSIVVGDPRTYGVEIGMKL